MNTDPQTDPRVKNLRDAQRRLRSALIANADRLDKPFTDDPDKNPWDTFVRPAMRELKAAVDAIASAPAAPVAAPPTGQAGLRERIAEALVSWTYRGQEPDPETGILETVRANAYSRADAVLLVLLGPIPAGTDTATWTAIRAIQLMNEAGRERDAATAEPHRLALSTALGLGTSAPWDAIRVRAAELAGQGVAEDDEGDELVCVDECGLCDACGMEPFGTPAEGWREAARFLRRTARDSADRAGALHGARLIEDELRRLAAETPGPETQDGHCDTSDAEPSEEQIVRDHVTTLHLIGEQLATVESWMWAHLADVRATPPAVVAEPGKECAASVSGNCLAEAQSDTGCATEDGECIHAGQPGKDPS